MEESSETSVGHDRLEKYGIKTYSPQEAAGWAIREVPDVFHEPLVPDLLALIQEEAVVQSAKKFHETDIGESKDMDTPPGLNKLFKSDVVRMERYSKDWLRISQADNESMGRDNRSVSFRIDDDNNVAAMKYNLSSNIGGDFASMSILIVTGPDQVFYGYGDKQARDGLRYWDPKPGAVAKKMLIQHRNREQPSEISQWEAVWEYADGEQQPKHFGKDNLDSNSFLGNRPDAANGQGNSYVKDQLLTALPGFSNEEISSMQQQFTLSEQS